MRRQIYFWIGIALVWVAAFFMHFCQPQCCPYSIAAAVSAIAAWIWNGC